MIVETVIHDVQTGREEIKEVEETIVTPETPPEPTLEEKVQELQNNILNLQSVLISQKISGGGGIKLTDSSGFPIRDFSMQGKTEQEENASIESPKEIINAGADGQIEVKVTGKNLFDISKNPYKCDEEKICIPSKRLGEINITNGITFEEKTVYYLSWESYTITKPNSDWSPIFGVKYTDGTNEDFYMHLNKSGFKTNANKTIGYVHIRNPWSVGTEVNRIQIEKGTERTEYEPFKLQVLTIPLDRPLTKWDRIEKRDGVYGIVYNSEHVIFNGGAEEKWIKSSLKNYFYLQGFTGLQKSYEIFCDKLENYRGSVNEITENKILGNTTGLYIMIDGMHNVDELKTWLNTNNLDVWYYSKEQEFVPLPEETQIALNSLHTNYPTTVITNSEDCEMEVEYICDTKNYVDKRIIQLAKINAITNIQMLENKYNVDLRTQN